MAPIAARRKVQKVTGKSEFYIVFRYKTKRGKNHLLQKQRWRLEQDPQAVRAFEQVEGRHEAIERVLLSLTENQRAVIQARYYRDLTLEQTGRVLGMTKGEAQRAE